MHSRPHHINLQVYRHIAIAFSAKYLHTAFDDVEAESWEETEDGTDERARINARQTAHKESTCARNYAQLTHSITGGDYLLFKSTSQDWHTLLDQGAPGDSVPAQDPNGRKPSGKDQDASEGYWDHFVLRMPALADLTNYTELHDLAVELLDDLSWGGRR